MTVAVKTLACSFGLGVDELPLRDVALQEAGAVEAKLRVGRRRRQGNDGNAWIGRQSLPNVAGRRLRRQTLRPLFADARRARKDLRRYLRDAPHGGGIDAAEAQGDDPRPDELAI